MRIIFLGTKGEIEEHNKKHKYNSSFLLESGKFKLLFEHGHFHKKKISQIRPSAVLISHAHPDHYIWTTKDEKTRVPIYATKETIDYGKFRPENFKIIYPDKKFRFGPFTITAFRVLHSLRCPAVCFRISIGKKNILYSGDLVDIIYKGKALKNIDYYIGDGSSINANLVRKRGSKFFGHARITTQINWCKKFGIKNIIFTHLGKETLRKEKQFKKIYPEIIFAYDGMKMEI